MILTNVVPPYIIVPDPKRNLQWLSIKAYPEQDDLVDSFLYGKRSHAVSAEKALVDAMKNDFLENMVQYMPQF